MDKSDWSLLGEFTFIEFSHHNIVGIYHKKCKSNIVITPLDSMSVESLVKELIKHKKDDCNRLQGLKSKITIYDEVDNG